MKTIPLCIILFAVILVANASSYYSVVHSTTTFHFDPFKKDQVELWDKGDKYVGSASQLNSQLVMVQRDLVEKYNNFYEHLSVVNKTGSHSTVIYIWKHPNLNYYPDSAILVLNNAEELNQFAEHFLKAMELVKDDEEFDLGLDLDGDGVVDLKDEAFSKFARIIKKLFNYYFLKYFMAKMGDNADDAWSYNVSYGPVVTATENN